MLKNGTNNTLRGRIVQLLQQEDEEAIVFKGYLARLHLSLERHDLCSRQERLTFKRCFIGLNSNNQINEKGFNGTTYILERGIGRALQQNLKQSSVFCEVISKYGKVRYSKLQTRFLFSEIEEDEVFRVLKRDEQIGLLERYERINPRLMIDLLNTDNSRPPRGLSRRNESTATIDAGAVQFCDHPEHVFAGLIEIIYGLRNMLFHGDLAPTSEMNAVYEPAYFILRTFLKAID